MAAALGRRVGRRAHAPTSPPPPAPSCWRSDDAWQRIDAVAERAARAGGPAGTSAIGPGLVLRDGEVHLTADADPAGPTPTLVAAGRGRPPPRATPASTGRRSTGWPPTAAPLPEPVARRRAGRARRPAARRATEPSPSSRRSTSSGCGPHVLPEWEAVRSKPQRNAYHRFTVDRHLMETAANAAALVARTDRPDLLVLGALLHDIGKGYPGDHTEVGIELLGRASVRGWGSRRATSRCSRRWSATTCCSPTSPPAATSTTRPRSSGVADAVGDRSTLGLLAALTEADSLATGPAAWGRWKAELVRDLVGRVGPRPRRRDGRRGPRRLPRRRSTLALLRAGQQVLRGEGDRITVVAADRQGLFSRVTGVLALHGLGVLDAARDQPGRHGARGAPRGVELRSHHRLGQGRSPTSRRCSRGGSPSRPGWRSGPASTAAASGGPRSHEPPRVVVDNEASRDATVVEVARLRLDRRALPDHPGARRARARTSCRPRCRPSARRVVDAFYVRDMAGDKLTDPATLVEVERALLHELST